MLRKSPKEWILRWHLKNGRVGKSFQGEEPACAEVKNLTLKRNSKKVCGWRGKGREDEAERRGGARACGASKVRPVELRIDPKGQPGSFISYNIRHVLTISSYSTPKYLPKRNKNLCAKRLLHEVHSSFIHQRLQTGNNSNTYQPAMDKETMVHPHWGIL